MSDASYIDQYLSETRSIAEMLDRAELLNAIALLRGIRGANGRLFILGVGGSAGNASHAVNDFRKIAGIESYAPTDNVSELTAWTNDSGWDQVFDRWLTVSKLGAQDALLVLSVGGGSQSTSQNLVKAMDLAKAKGAKIVAIVSRDGGHAAKVADACILVPVLDAARITPHAEGWQAVIWHLLVNALVQP